jgi:hypothetical protein
MHGGEADDEEIETQLVNILLGVQWFICNSARRAWPSDTPLPPPPTELSREHSKSHVAELDAIVPDAKVSLDDGMAKLWWEHEGRVILTLQPISLASR